MLGFDQAQELLAQSVDRLTDETVPLSDAAGRVTAQQIISNFTSPRQAVSAMDGYAVCGKTTLEGARLTVIGQSLAGCGYSGTVESGQAVRIFTGAPIPAGADRVIMQEQVDRDGDAIIVAPGFGPGWHVRPRGRDFAAGDVLVESGVRLTPRALVSAAAADCAEIKVSCKPRVAIVATGDELVPPGSSALRPETIPDSISSGISAFVTEMGGLVSERIIACDNLNKLKGIASEVVTLADVVVITGGASVGDRDFGKPMFADLGSSLVFDKVAIKPGKPVWLARVKQCWLLGLPGNPTAAMVTARLFLAPLLARLQGQSFPPPLQWRSMPLAAALPSSSGRETFVRARLIEAGLVPIDNQDSAAQRALATADWLIRCPANLPAKPPGQMVAAIPF